MGFTKAGLARWREVLGRHDDVPNLVAAIRVGDEVHVEALRTPRESVYRISSMTKPITAVAAWMLIEECRLRLDDSIEELLPELANRRVLKDLRGPLDGPTEPAKRAITARDLLTMKMGFGQFMADPAKTPILRALIDRLNGFGPPEPQKTPAPDDAMKILGELPWMAQPGERWLYNTAFDVLGVLIARVSGQPFERFLEERIFAPLGMKDTAFHSKKLSDHYQEGEVFDPADGQFSRAPQFASGAGGLVSTVDDYLTFTRALGANTLISRAAHEVMTTDQLTPEQHARDGLMPGDFAAMGYGLGVGVVTRRDGFENVGTYGWDGGMGSSWRTDPRTGLTGVLLTPTNWSEPLLPKVHRDFWTSAHAALD